MRLIVFCLLLAGCGGSSNVSNVARDLGASGTHDLWGHDLGVRDLARAPTSDLAARDISFAPDLLTPQSGRICEEAVCATDSNCTLAPWTRCAVDESGRRHCRPPCSAASDCSPAQLGTPASGWSCSNAICVEATCGGDGDCTISPWTRCATLTDGSRHCRPPCNKASDCNPAQLGSPATGWSCSAGVCVEAVCRSDGDCTLAPWTRCGLTDGAYHCRVPCTAVASCAAAQQGTPASGWSCE